MRKNLLFLGFIASWLVLPIFAQAQIINVDDAPYNAVGDGVTDDQAAIQQAIWDFRSTGGTLQFTSGKTYIISEGLIFDTYSDTHNYLVTSTGSEKATIKIKDGTNLDWNRWVFRLSSSNNITLRNLILDGNRDHRDPLPTIETSGTDVLFINGASNGTRLENLDLINSPMDNLYITVHYNQGETIMTDFEMHNCKLDNGFRNNMSVISGSSFKIVGCEFTNANGTLPEAGIDFEPNDNTDPYTNMLIEGCLFKDNHNFGIELTYTVAGSGSSTVKDNLFVNNGLLIASKDNVIHHNIFVDQDHQHKFGAGTRDGVIYFHTGHTATGNEVFNNYFYDNNMPAGSHLIKFMYNCGGGNSVHDNYGHGNTVDGFVAEDTDPDTDPGQTVTNNTFLAKREMGYWNMDAAEIAGNTINDLSDFNHDGTITDATSVVGVENEALDFAPDDRYVTIPANGNLDIEMNFTVLAWIKWSGANANEAQQAIVGRGADWHFGVSNNGQLELVSPISAGTIQSPADAIPTNQWKLATATYNGRRVKLYIDGIEVANEQANGSLGTTLANLYIGSFTTTTNSFNGIIDDVRIYNYSLSQLEIQTIFDATPLAVEWIDPLLATKRDNSVYLKWTVDQQVNNDKFVVEHSVDGHSFQAIETIPGDGSLSILKGFRAIHKNPNIGDNYYRVKQIDYDGQFDYSNVAYVYFDKVVIDLYPNPAHNVIHLQLENDGLLQMAIYNNLGQFVKSLSQNSKIISIEDLPIGMYWIRVTSQGQTSTLKFTKE